MNSWPLKLPESLAAKLVNTGYMKYQAGLHCVRMNFCSQILTAKVNPKYVKCWGVWITNTLIAFLFTGAFTANTCCNGMVVFHTSYSITVNSVRTKKSWGFDRKNIYSFSFFICLSGSFDQPIQCNSNVSFAFQVVLISLYSVTAMFALSGNLLVIVVLSCSKVRNELAKYLLNLAVADFLFATFSVPFR